MSTAWALRQEELFSDCTVSPDIFSQMVDRLGEFVVPYQQALEASPFNMSSRRYQFSGRDMFAVLIRRTRGWFFLGASRMFLISREFHRGGQLA